MLVSSLAVDMLFRLKEPKQRCLKNHTALKVVSVARYSSAVLASLVPLESVLQLLACRLNLLLMLAPQSLVCSFDTSLHAMVLNPKTQNTTTEKLKT